MTSKNVLISGAGVAGPALAHWLHRYGFTVTVVERAPSPRTGGYKVDVRGAAVTVLRRMGLLDQVTAAGTAMREVVFVDDRGRTTATLPAALFAAHEGDDVEVMRGELGRILHESTREHVEYRFGDEITALAETTEGVRVTFRHAEPRTFDLVVGADGLHSRVRALAFGPEEAHLRHLGCHLAVAGVPNHLGLDRSERMHVTPGRTTNVYSTRGMTDARALFLFPSPPADQLPDRHDSAGQRRLVAELFADQRWEVPRLLADLPSTSDFYFDSISQVHLDRWSAGRVVLLGDAGYSPSPATGQGTSLALVGAYVLAGELAAARGDHRTAFAEYERRLREFVRRNQDLGPKLVRTMVARSRFQVWLTTRMMSALPHLPGRDRMISRVVRPIQDAAHAVDLPDYVTCTQPSRS